MTSQRVRREEQAAGALVAWELGGWWAPLDVPGAQEGTHDLEVRRIGAGAVALEVTSAGDRSREELRRLLFGNEWKAPSLQHHWWLGFDEEPAPQVRSLMEKIPAHLAVLERHDVQTIRAEEPLPPGLAAEAVDAARGVFGLRCKHATRLSVPEPGEAPLLLSSLSSGFTDRARSC